MLEKPWHGQVSATCNKWSGQMAFFCVCKDKLIHFEPQQDPQPNQKRSLLDSGVRQWQSGLSLDTILQLLRWCKTSYRFCLFLASFAFHLLGQPTLSSACFASHKFCFKIKKNNVHPQEQPEHPTARSGSLSWSSRACSCAPSFSC